MNGMTNLESLENYAAAAIHAHSALPSVTSKQLEELKRLAKYETPEMLRRKVESWREKATTPAFPGFPQEVKKPEPPWQPCNHFKDQPWYSGDGTRICSTCEREAAEQKQFEVFADATGSKQLTTVARGRKVIEGLHTAHGKFVERWTKKQAKRYFEGHITPEFLKDLVAQVWLKVIESVDGYTETGIEAASAKWLMKIIQSVVNDHAKYLFAKMRDVRQTVEWNEATENRRARGNSGPVSKPTSFGHSAGASPKIGKDSIGENSKQESWDQRQNVQIDSVDGRKYEPWGVFNVRVRDGVRAGQGWSPSEAEKELERHARAMERLSRMIARRKALEAVVATATAVGVVGVQAGTLMMEGAA